VALTDILTDSANVSAIIEVFTLFFIVAGFFRWYDSRYQKTIRDVKEEAFEKLGETQKILCDRLERIDSEVMRLDERFHKHLTDDSVHNHHSTKGI
jgi:hypothetical protein